MDINFKNSQISGKTFPSEDSRSRLSQASLLDSRKISIQDGLNIKLRRTLGLELEAWGEYFFRYDCQGLNYRQINDITLPLLLSTRFLDLYTLHGKTSDGRWVENYLPAEMLTKLMRGGINSNYNCLMTLGIIIPDNTSQGIHSLPLPFFSQKSDKTATGFSVQDWKKWKQPQQFDQAPSLSSSIYSKYEYYFHLILAMLFELRGRDKEDIFQIRKRQSAWNALEDKNPNDDLMPERIAESWEGECYMSNLQEFTINGFVETGQELKDFTLHLQKRLGIFAKTPQAQELHERLWKSNVAAYKNLCNKVIKQISWNDRIPGHVHWVPRNIMDHSPQERLLILKALVGYWGSINDFEQITKLNSNYNSHFEIKEEELKVLETLLKNPHKINVKIWEFLSIKDNLTNGRSLHMRLLKRSTYERVSISERGVRIINQKVGLNPLTDKNIPTDFKYLLCGLRSGPYTQKTYRADEDNPIVGLEMRGSIAYAALKGHGYHASYLESYKQLPKCKPKTDQVDMVQFLAHATEDSRGTEDRFSKYMQITELPGDFFQRILYAINQHVEPTNWTAEDILVEMLTPLTPWLEHTLVKAKLSKFSPKEAEAAKTTYQKAYNSYLDLLKSFERKARNNTIDDHQLIAALHINNIFFIRNSEIGKLFDMDISVQVPEESVEDFEEPVNLALKKEEIELEKEEDTSTISLIDSKTINANNEALTQRSEAFSTYLKSLRNLQEEVDTGRINNIALAQELNKLMETFFQQGGLI